LCEKLGLGSRPPLPHPSIAAQRPLGAPLKDRDERLRGGGSARHPKVPSPSTALAVADVQALTGGTAVGSCVLGENGLFSASAGGALVVPVASACACPDGLSGKPGICHPNQPVPGWFLPGGAEVKPPSPPKAPPQKQGGVHGDAAAPQPLCGPAAETGASSRAKESPVTSSGFHGNAAD